MKASAANRGRSVRVCNVGLLAEFVDICERRGWVPSEALERAVMLFIGDALGREIGLLSEPCHSGIIAPPTKE